MIDRRCLPSAPDKVDKHLIKLISNMLSAPPLQRGSCLACLLSPVHAAVEMRSLTNQTSTERIYSVSQLSDALQSGLMGLKDQLQVRSRRLV